MELNASHYCYQESLNRKSIIAGLASLFAIFIVQITFESLFTLNASLPLPFYQITLFFSSGIIFFYIYDAHTRIKTNINIKGTTPHIIEYGLLPLAVFKFFQITIESLEALLIMQSLALCTSSVFFLASLFPKLQKSTIQTTTMTIYFACILGICFVEYFLVNPMSPMIFEESWLYIFYLSSCIYVIFIIIAFLHTDSIGFPPILAYVFLCTISSLLVQPDRLTSSQTLLLFSNAILLYTLLSQRSLIFYPLSSTPQVTQKPFQSKVNIALPIENSLENSTKNAYRNTENLIYMAAHDLKEPLHTITNYAHLLENNTLSEANKTKYLSTIIASSNRMSELIMHVLEHASTNTPKPLETFCSQQATEDVIEDLKYIITTTRTIINISPLPIIDGYAAEYRSLIQNLIINAIKFRKPDTPCYIEITVEKLDSSWHFSVCDNGIGVKDHESANLFSMFKSHANPFLTDKKRSTGLGLSICQKIVEAHGGSIWLVSNANKGTTVHFTITRSLASL